MTRARPWQEYLIEAALLGIFMVSACLFSVAFEHPDSPLSLWIQPPLLRRALIGMAMGLTAVGLIYSPWGRRSGAHFNPSVTLTFLRLRKIDPRDALAYVGAQGAGALAGVGIARLLLGALVAHPAVDFAATKPGAGGVALAFAAEGIISFVLMTVVLIVSNSRWARWTGVCCGLLVATYITIEAPLSGMSMNPARTLGSALWAWRWEGWWIYCIAPPLGMLFAAELHVRAGAAVGCAKLWHPSLVRCIFCEYQHGRAASVTVARSGTAKISDQASAAV
jgi:aquaporin Z